MSNINWAFALLGKITAIAIAFGLVAIAVMLIKEKIKRVRWKCVYKHRFDKPPTAKCYCRDCKKHNNSTERCSKFEGRCTADNWFCWDAEPKDKEAKS
jgi:hypothetical protein